jgi:hypothetical protein
MRPTARTSILACGFIGGPSKVLKWKFATASSNPNTVSFAEDARNAFRVSEKIGMRTTCEATYTQSVNWNVPLFIRALVLARVLVLRSASLRRRELHNEKMETAIDPSL